MSSLRPPATMHDQLKAFSADVFRMPRATAMMMMPIPRSDAPADSSTGGSSTSSSASYSNMAAESGSAFADENGTNESESGSGSGSAFATTTTTTTTTTEMDDWITNAENGNEGALFNLGGSESERSERSENGDTTTAEQQQQQHRQVVASEPTAGIVPRRGEMMMMGQHRPHTHASAISVSDLGFQHDHPGAVPMVPFAVHDVPFYGRISPAVHSNGQSGSPAVHSNGYSKTNGYGAASHADHTPSRSSSSKVGKSTRPVGRPRSRSPGSRSPGSRSPGSRSPASRSRVDGNENAGRHEKKTPAKDRLKMAIANGDVKESIRIMLEEKAYSYNRTSALHLACVYGRIEIAKAIFDRGLGYFMRAGISERSPLHEAVITAWCYKQKNFKETLELLRAKIPGIMSHVDVKGNNVLHTLSGALTSFHNVQPENVADFSEYAQIIESYFADIMSLWDTDDAIPLLLDAKNNKGQTPLMYFAMGGSSDAVKVLLDHGANSKVLDKEKATVLHLMVQHPYVFKRKAFKTLVELLQPDFGAISADGNTVLQDIGCVLNSTEKKQKDSYPETEIDAFVSYLEDLWSIASERNIVNVFNVDHQDKKGGDTALIVFTDANCVKGVTLLVEGFGAKVSIKNKNGETALSIARDPKIKELLTKKLEEEQEHRSSSLESVEVVVQSSPEPTAMSTSSSDASASALAGRSTASVRNMEAATKPVLSAPTASPAATGAATTSAATTRVVATPVVTVSTYSAAAMSAMSAATSTLNKHNVEAPSVSTTTTTTMASSSSSSSSGKRKRAAESDEEVQSVAESDEEVQIVAAPISPTKRARSDPLAAMDPMTFLAAKFAGIKKELRRTWAKLDEVNDNLKVITRRNANNDSAA